MSKKGTVTELNCDVSFRNCGVLFCFGKVEMVMNDIVAELNCSVSSRNYKVL